MKPSFVRPAGGPQALASVHSSEAKRALTTISRQNYRISRVIPGPRQAGERAQLWLGDPAEHSSSLRVRGSRASHQVRPCSSHHSLHSEGRALTHPSLHTHQTSALLGSSSLLFPKTTSVSPWVSAPLHGHRFPAGTGPLTISQSRAQKVHSFNPTLSC